jgi:hypothetical protein
VTVGDGHRDGRREAVQSVKRDAGDGEGAVGKAQARSISPCSPERRAQLAQQ